jgi:hypothetical protein
MACRIVSMPVDCTDAPMLARFWAEVLGWEVTSSGWQRTEHGPDGVSIAPPDGGPFAIDFRWTPDSKTAKNRIHLDLNPTDREQPAELERLLALGARRVDVGQRADSTWHVLADPEGNELCLCRARVDPVRPQEGAGSTQNSLPEGSR